MHLKEFNGPILTMNNLSGWVGGMVLRGLGFESIIGHQCNNLII